jgi:hypothetical protein
MAIQVDDNGSDGNNNGEKAADTSASTPSEPNKQPPQAPGKKNTFAAAAAAASNTGTQGAAPQTQQASHQTTNNTQSQGTRSMISTRQNYGISRAATSQAMRAIVEVTDKIAEGEVDQPVKFAFFALDGEKEGLLISALVVAAVLKGQENAGEKYVAYHTLLLAQTARGQTAVEAQFGNGIKYERLVVPADAYDATLRARVVQIISDNYRGYTLIDAESNVVPADLDLRSEEAVRNVIANATTATSVMLATMVAEDSWTITPEMAQQTFQNEIKSSWGHFVDLNGQPVRGDVVLEMSMLTGKQQNNQNTGEFQYNTSQAKTLLTQLLGYIDLTSTPSTASSPAQFGGMGNMAQTPDQLKIYTPRLVITNIDAPDDVCELPVILQGLATTQALYNDNRWIGALIQQHKNGASHQEGGMNIRDLSAIGLEAPQQMPMGYMGGELPKAGRLPLNSANVNDAALAAVIQTYFHLEPLLISMDVPESGPSSWITGVFAAAARGDQNAIKDLFDAADLLTGGKFSPIYKAANGGVMKAPVFNDNMYVNNGFYFAQGGKRDIRDGDYLCVLNATGDSELETINDWSNLQANAEVDPMFRLTETRRIQQGLFESMTITGRSVRVTFNPTFIYAIAAAVAEAGIVYETKVGVSAPQGTARMVAPYMRNLPTNLGTAGSFVPSGMRRNAAAGVAAGSFGRYAHQRATNTGGAGNY